VLPASRSSTPPASGNELGAHRSQRAHDLETGELFAGWGIPTPESIRQLGASTASPIIGSGGLRSGVDVAKAFALGADLGGLAQPSSKRDRFGRARGHASTASSRELKIAMFCLSSRTVSDLKSVPIRMETER
jgi:isopentenyl-diphosphate delta-isomerase